jgi:hypothetical protein
MICQHAAAERGRVIGDLMAGAIDLGQKPAADSSEWGTP